MLAVVGYVSVTLTNEHGLICQLTSPAVDMVVSQRMLRIILLGEFDHGSQIFPPAAFLGVLTGLAGTGGRQVGSGVSLFDHMRGS